MLKGADIAPIDLVGVGVEMIIAGRANDRKVLSGIIYVIKHGLQWTDARAEYGPRKTLYNRFRRWSENGVFERIFEDLAKPQDGEGNVLMIDATHLKAHRTASSLKKGVKSQG